ncbi:Gfo/Idh/MocA family oxidoreductase [Paenibacillus sp. HB172176]|uniref:Gfo/Idh/MocA family protein n=1 Tax=Paenibacillus sp. HB172176 TaxID=2493690 RepID=UPI00143AFF03|nr:Gfo/Idh/MocA family oxidoreductase [Paenibacillus sp. HB172176]
MTQKLRVAAVGVGNIFQSLHAKPLMEHPEVELVAVCDTNLERAQAVAKEHGIATACADYKELLGRDDIDAFDICTPNLYHSLIAVDALNAGKHVFCEKPDAVSPEEAKRMADAAEKSGKLLMTMRNNRFMPSSKCLKQYIDEGSMGDIYTGRCGWVRRRGIPGKGGWFTTKELSGGGPLIDLGVHMIDLAVWLMGNPKPVTVTGATYTKFANNELSDSIHSSFGEKQEDGTFDVEDLATGFIRFDNGATLQLEFSWASNIGEEMKFVELRGTKSGAFIKNSELQIFSEAAGELVDIHPVLGKRGGYSAHGAHLDHFVDCVLHGAEPIIVPQHGVDMIKILSALYRSAETGREVVL